jgi:signal transduction histidine kinase
MAHRPPLRPRFWVYSATAYLAPVLLQLAWPGRDSVGDELIWLITLVPAFLLSLHYGLRGALAGLLLGTTLFAVVQGVLALNLVPDDWHITLPIWIAYGTLAVSVGWLSEGFHAFYQRALQAERLAAIGEASPAIRHELADALSVIQAEAELLEGPAAAERARSARLIRESARQSARLLMQLTQLEVPPPTLRYSMGAAALDLRDVTPRPRET